ncbi:uncharacterized protein B0H18DRAFT_880019 [Fomitopsis serialis]|uniref:uncharacterized protein n=1 Tax=Fomitopsis serialis TaxID=139415 RepID=UPI0020087A4C|nr:uncharacterized protein B0H18DRAFT_880019 [Neoantrodia serialis]KAH9921595.1 hypothetical protein B0H18DRAFT_880019 [Neoantrodia serialis]
MTLPTAPFVRPGYEDGNICPACDKPFRTSQGVMAHLSTARSCKWFRKGKNAVPRVYDVPDVIESIADNDTGSGAGPDAMDQDPEDFLDVLQHRELFRFDLPSSPAADSRFPGEGEASSSNTMAGRVIRMEERIVDTWKAYFAEDPGEEAQGDDVPMEVDGEEGPPAACPDPNLKWRPFASELDWQVAMWVIREDVGQKSLNRFLSIPGVVEKLGLTFKDVRQLFMKVDTIPDRATWKTTSLTFPDRLDEVHLIRYRDILEAIKALLGNPAHAKHIVYRPRRVFADTSKTRRIFTEMWTGLWWSSVQVR